MLLDLVANEACLGSFEELSLLHDLHNFTDTTNVTDTWDYDAFGNVIGRTGTTANDFTYRGEQMDSALGLQYLRARWMRSSSATFLAPDTHAGNPKHTASLNRYSYAENDGVDGCDPTGHELTLSETTVAAAVAGTLTGINAGYNAYQRTHDLGEAFASGIVVGGTTYVGTFYGLRIITSAYKAYTAARAVQAAAAAIGGSTPALINQFETEASVAMQAFSSAFYSTDTMVLGTRPPSGR